MLLGVRMRGWSGMWEDGGRAESWRNCSVASFLRSIGLIRSFPRMRLKCLNFRDAIELQSGRCLSGDVGIYCIYGRLGYLARRRYFLTSTPSQKVQKNDFTCQTPASEDTLLNITSDHIHQPHYFPSHSHWCSSFTSLAYPKQCSQEL